LMNFFVSLNGPVIGVLAPDLRGHGATDVQGETGDSTRGVLTADAIALLQHPAERRLDAALRRLVELYEPAVVLLDEVFRGHRTASGGRAR
jgi:pimeloyl-ACP methyl ester carboxylesterase